MLDIIWNIIFLGNIGVGLYNMINGNYAQANTSFLIAIIMNLAKK